VAVFTKRQITWLRGYLVRTGKKGLLNAYPDMKEKGTFYVQIPYLFSASALLLQDYPGASIQDHSTPG
jgi:hypothetical protein